MPYGCGLRNLWGVAELLECLDFLARQPDVIGSDDVKGALVNGLTPSVQLSRWVVSVKALAFAESQVLVSSSLSSLPLFHCRVEVFLGTAHRLS